MPIVSTILIGIGAALPSAIPTTAWAAPPSEPPTCFGETATIVGSPFESITGTDGRDVVVSNGAEHVNTGRGNDLLCITAALDLGTYATGAGNDRIIHASEPAESDALIQIDPGAGMDNVIGGPWEESILAAHAHNGRGDRDTISAGGGSDSVDTGGESAKGDTIDLGEGEDSVYIKRSPPAGALNVIGDGDDDLLALWRPGTKTLGSLVLDNVTGQLARDGLLVAQFEGFTSFDVIVRRPFTFTGADAAEQLNVTPKRGYPNLSDWTFDLSMGAGDDTLNVPTVTPDSRYDGGEGTDLFRIGSEFTPVGSSVFDVSAGTLQETIDGHTTTRTAIRFEDIDMYTDGPATIFGTDGPNQLAITQVNEPPSQTLMDGRAGDDVLRGARGNDTLVGGAGDDSADGGDGTDECLTEASVNCES